MIVKESHVAAVVKEISGGAAEEGHVASVVGAFMQRQATVGQYVSAHSKELSLEGVVLALLHASVLLRAVELAAGRRLRALRFVDLDAAASADAKTLAAEEPELWGYVEGNVPADDATLGGKRREPTLQLLAVISRAFVNQVG